MIVPLSPEQEHQLAQSLARAIPQQLLRLIATAQALGAPSSLVNLSGQLRRWLPTSCAPPEFPSLVRESLSWFRQHGDVELGRGGLYTCPPPYIVGHLQASEKPRKVLLLGSPLYDPLLTQRLATLSYSQYPVTMDGKRIGWERSLTLPAEGEYSESNLGLACFDLGSVRSRIPTLRQALLPPASDSALSVPTWGFWERYVPGGDWVADQVKSTAMVQLWRWRGAEDQHPDQGRYFLAVPGPQASLLRELLSEQVTALWQLWLDREAGASRVCYHDQGTLYIPRGLLLSVDRWLQWEQRLAAEEAQPPLQRWSPRYRRYLLASSTAATEAATLLHQRLALLIREGVPVE